MHTPRNIQAPYAAADFWTQWSSTAPRMALFVKITPQSFWTSVDTVGITSNTRDMTLPGHSGITFKSTPGITPTVIEQAIGEPANLEMTGIYQSGIFEYADVIAGKWSFAEIEIFSACWDNTDLGELVHFRGNLGDLRDYQTFFTAEARGLISRLSNEVNKVTQKFCRVKDFRDNECGHTAATVTISATAYNVVETGLATISTGPFTGAVYVNTGSFAGNIPPDGFYANGKITAETGVNEGVSREIANSIYNASPSPHIKIHLKRPFPFLYTPEVDTFELTAGCNRTIEDCRKFDNVINRRAEDWIPTIEDVNRVPPSS